MQEILRKLKEEFKEITFENENHIYTVEDKEYTPVTNITKRFYKPFDKGIAFGVAKKRGVHVKEILDEWEEKRNTSANNGTEVHLFGEMLFKDEVSFLNLNDELLPYKIGVFKYKKELPSHIKPLMPELKLYSKKYKIAGTIDMPLYDELNEGIYIDDYKTNENLFKCFNKNLLNPFNFMLETPYTKYKLQLSLYKLLLEEKGFKVLKARLIHILPYDYKIYDLEGTDDIIKLLKENL